MGGEVGSEERKEEKGVNIEFLKVPLLLNILDCMYVPFLQEVHL